MYYCYCDNKLMDSVKVVKQINTFGSTYDAIKNGKIFICNSLDKIEKEIERETKYRSCFYSNEAFRSQILTNYNRVLKIGNDLYSEAKYQQALPYLDSAFVFANIYNSKTPLQGQKSLPIQIGNIYSLMINKIDLMYCGTDKLKENLKMPVNGTYERMSGFLAYYVLNYKLTDLQVGYLSHYSDLMSTAEKEKRKIIETLAIQKRISLPNSFIPTE